MKRFFDLFRGSARKPAHSQEPDVTPASAKKFVDAVPIGPGVIYPDMLPENVWGSNLRGLLSRADWDLLRIPVCEKARNCCEVCGQPGFDPETGKPRRPDCHELWHFEVRATSTVQRLARLIALCPDCHRVQHAGRASVRGELSMVISHLRAINSWSDSEIRIALDNAEERYKWRRRFDWDLDLSLLAGSIRVKGSPNLLISAAERPQLGNSYFNR